MPGVERSEPPATLHQPSTNDLNLTVEAPEWIPRITRRRGTKSERLFWQSGGGFDRNVIEPKTLMKRIDYVHMNPVSRGLVQRPEEWFWSSAKCYLEGGKPPIAPDPIPGQWLEGLS
jgi:putative transposase